MAHWGVTAEEIRALAMQHMNEKMRQAEVDFIDVDTRRIAILGTEETNLKASLMLTEEFARRMKAEFTWPVYTLVPAESNSSPVTVMIGWNSPTRPNDTTGSPVTNPLNVSWRNVRSLPVNRSSPK